MCKYRYCNAEHRYKSNSNHYFRLNTKKGFVYGYADENPCYDGKCNLNGDRCNICAGCDGNDESDL